MRRGKQPTSRTPAEIVGSGCEVCSKHCCCMFSTTYWSIMPKTNCHKVQSCKAHTCSGIVRKCVRGCSRVLAVCSRVFADVRGHSRTFAGIRGRSRTFADVRGHSRVFMGLCSRTFAGVRGFSLNLLVLLAATCLRWNPYCPSILVVSTRQNMLTHSNPCANS
jgi:hypothetical protein